MGQSCTEREIRMQRLADGGVTVNTPVTLLVSVNVSITLEVDVNTPVVLRSV